MKKMSGEQIQVTIIACLIVACLTAAIIAGILFPHGIHGH